MLYLDDQASLFAQLHLIRNPPEALPAAPATAMPALAKIGQSCLAKLLENDSTSTLTVDAPSNLASKCATRRDPLADVTGDACTHAPLLHEWLYEDSPACSAGEVMRAFDGIKPILTEAVQLIQAGGSGGGARSKRPLGHKQDAMAMQSHMVGLGPNQGVQGPLTWRDFHKLACRGAASEQARGCNDVTQPGPLAIPSLVVAHEKDAVTVSPFALRYWVTNISYNFLIIFSSICQIQICKITMVLISNSNVKNSIHRTNLSFISSIHKTNLSFISIEFIVYFANCNYRR